MRAPQRPDKELAYLGTSQLRAPISYRATSLFLLGTIQGAVTKRNWEQAALSMLHP
jgi:hypothetical protein